MSGEIRSISVPEKDLSYFSLQVNLITVFPQNGVLVWFRQMNRHLDWGEYLKRSLDLFYTIVSKPQFVDDKRKYMCRTDFTKDEIQLFKEYISNKDFVEFAKLMRPMSTSREKYKFSIQHNCVVSDEFKLGTGMSDIPLTLNEMLPMFYTYMRSVSIEYKNNIWVPKGYHHSFNASRQVASYLLAKSLKCEELYVESSIVKLIVDGIERIGVLCSNASGVQATRCRATVTPSLYHSLCNLHVIDALCYQEDHWLQNYNILTNENGCAVSVCAFDNDYSTTFSIKPTLQMVCTTSGSRFVGDDGHILMPHMDKNLANTILTVDDIEIEKMLSPYLNNLQLWALKQRFKRMRREINHKISEEPLFLLEDSEWTIEYMSDELSGKYGCTYLCAYAKYWNL